MGTGKILNVPTIQEKNWTYGHPKINRIDKILQLKDRHKLMIIQLYSTDIYLSTHEWKS